VLLQDREQITAVEVRGKVTLGNEPKMTWSKRVVPVARPVMRRLDEHLARFVAPEADAVVFVGPRGGPLFRSFGRPVWHPAPSSGRGWAQ
jgi:hypothetical protein